MADVIVMCHCGRCFTTNEWNFLWQMLLPLWQIEIAIVGGVLSQMLMPVVVEKTLMSISSEVLNRTAS